MDWYLVSFRSFFIIKIKRQMGWKALLIRIQIVFYSSFRSYKRNLKRGVCVIDGGVGRMLKRMVVCSQHHQHSSHGSSNGGYDHQIHHAHTSPGTNGGSDSPDYKNFVRMEEKFCPDGQNLGVFGAIRRLEAEPVDYSRHGEVSWKWWASEVWEYAAISERDKSEPTRFQARSTFSEALRNTPTSSRAFPKHSGFPLPVTNLPEAAWSPPPWGSPASPTLSRPFPEMLGFPLLCPEFSRNCSAFLSFVPSYFEPKQLRSLTFHRIKRGEWSCATLLN